jgi:hypothetical protein
MLFSFASNKHPIFVINLCAEHLLNEEEFVFSKEFLFQLTKRNTTYAN